MSADEVMVRAIQGWRWMPGQSHVAQSFIVRVPEAELEAELARQCAATAALPGWLPKPNIVHLPATGEFTRILRSYDGAFATLTIDTGQRDSMEFSIEEASCDRTSANLSRAEVERLYAQLGAWLRIDPPVGNVPCPTCGEYDPYDCTCPDREKQGGGA